MMLNTLFSRVTPTRKFLRQNDIFLPHYREVFWTVFLLTISAQLNLISYKHYKHLREEGEVYH